MGVNQLQDALKDAGFRKGPSGVRQRRAELPGHGHDCHVEMNLYPVSVEKII